MQFLECVAMLYNTRTLKLFLFFFLIMGVLAKSYSDSFLLTRNILGDIETKYGAPARDRVQAWVDLIDANQNKSEEEKIEFTNAYFNRLAFVDDNTHWGKTDYWATPIEMLATNGGDCEDFSIAKYFTLRALGISENHLRLSYVKALKLNQAHMVLTYTSKPGTVPLVLDNLEPEIKPATQRLDLQPIYSFNAEGLWLAKQRGASQQMGSSERVLQWRELLLRMQIIQPAAP
jgi:predicted transglutaminase-like cysteine proteinase